MKKIHKSVSFMSMIDNIIPVSIALNASPYFSTLLESNFAATFKADLELAQSSFPMQSSKAFHLG